MLRNAINAAVSAEITVTENYPVFILHNVSTSVVHPLSKCQFRNPDQARLQGQQPQSAVPFQRE